MFEQYCSKKYSFILPTNLFVERWDGFDLNSPKPFFVQPVQNRREAGTYG
jgi:hypothetical protein